MKNKLQFRVDSGTKDILGKDLITNRNIAIFELVKNSYDACATRVDIHIEKEKIVIIDDGEGMDINDLKDKWLRVGYSEKSDKNIKIQRRCNRRSFAGAKGIGRLGSDSLGKKLTLISIKNKGIEEIIVNWGDFEENNKIDFDKIDLHHRTLKQSPRKNFIQGTLLEIKNLRSSWIQDDIDKLERHLVKLISPVNEDKDRFDIYIHFDNKIKSVKNFIFDELGLKTTKINISVSKNGEEISTEVIDRGDKIYKIIEKNKWTKSLSGVKIELIYLNRPTKLSFHHLTKQRTVDFGSVFLYNNGFRVFPYGESGDDSLNIDRRKAQGYARYLGLRDLIGYISIDGHTEDFKEKSSRDGGLLETRALKELREFFIEKGLKRLESYAVDTLSWTYHKDTETELFPKDREKEINILIQKLTNSNEFIALEYDYLNFQQKIEKKVNEGFQGATGVLKKQAEKTNDKSLKNAIKRIEKVQKTQVDTIKKQEKKIEQKKKELEDEKKKGAFQGALITTDKERIVGMQHQIRHSSSRLNRNIQLLLNHLGGNIDPKIQKYIKVLSLETSKILSISNFITKANFNLKAANIETDIVSFIVNYIDEIYLFEDKIIDTDLKIQFIGDNFSFSKKFRPLELTTICDAFISNAEKAGAKNMEFSFRKDNENLLIKVMDNGKGIHTENFQKIFEFGYSTTDGSGIGLSQVKDLVENSLKGTISVDSEKNKQTIFTITI